MHLSTVIISILIATTLSISLFTQASETSAADSDMCGFSSSARFVESAPRDRFSFQNTSSSDWKITTLSLDLSSSAGNLIFDVTAAGAGVEVFQSFRAESGEAMLSTEPQVIDGDQSILLDFSTFNPADEYQFSIDVDDQLSQSELGQIRVSGGEIAGATITLEISNSNGDKRTVSGAFDKTNRVTLNSEGC